MPLPDRCPTEIQNGKGRQGFNLGPLLILISAEGNSRALTSGHQLRSAETAEAPVRTQLSVKLFRAGSLIHPLLKNTLVNTVPRARGSAIQVSCPLRPRIGLCIDFHPLIPELGSLEGGPKANESLLDFCNRTRAKVKNDYCWTQWINGNRLSSK